MKPFALKTENVPGQKLRKKLLSAPKETFFFFFLINENAEQDDDAELVHLNKEWCEAAIDP